MNTVHPYYPVPDTGTLIEFSDNIAKVRLDYHSKECSAKADQFFQLGKRFRHYRVRIIEGGKVKVRYRIKARIKDAQREIRVHYSVRIPNSRYRFTCWSHFFKAHNGQMQEASLVQRFLEHTTWGVGT